METLRENRAGYFSPIQREVLLQLTEYPVIEQSFFLTGGTALAVFHLHHRLSNDLDLFTLDRLDLSEIDFWVNRKWPGNCVKIKQSPDFFSCLIRETKVDFVVDPLSNREERPRMGFENRHGIFIDTITNIVSNKFCAMVSRTEPKDFVDFYFIFKSFPETSLDSVFNNARLKDGIFDDPPTVAFQIEEALVSLKNNLSTFPPLLKELNFDEFFKYYSDLVKWVYQKVKP